MAFYEQQLKELQRKMFFVQKEIDLTNFILDLLQTEKDDLVKEKLINAKAIIHDK